MAESPKFRDVKTFFDNNQRLGHSEQNELVRTIIDFFISKDVKLNSSYMQNLALQIIAMFSCESAEIYFEKPRNKRARGKLINRNSNFNKLCKKAKTMEEGNHTEKIISFTGNEEEATKGRQFLKYYYKDKEETTRRWKLSSEYRLQEILGCKDSTINAIIENWPAYKQHFGHDL